MDARSIDEAMVRSAVPVAARPAWAALLELDATLGGIVRHTREPLVGQMRLTWWHGALCALDGAAPPPAQPLLHALAAEVLPRSVRGEALADMVDGWEVLLDGPALDDAALERFAGARGREVFGALAQIVGGSGGGADVMAAGQGWALADLAPRLTDAAAAHRARSMADARFGAAFAGRWARAVRPLGALALVARAELSGSPAPGSPALALRLVRHRLTGR